MYIDIHTLYMFTYFPIEVQISPCHMFDRTIFPAPGAHATSSSESSVGFVSAARQGRAG